jgi:hypothetical protein
MRAIPGSVLVMIAFASGGAAVVSAQTRPPITAPSDVSNAAAPCSIDFLQWPVLNVRQLGFVNIRSLVK